VCFGGVGKLARAEKGFADFQVDVAFVAFAGRGNKGLGALEKAEGFRETRST
jgi:hypothetical protein